MNTYEIVRPAFYIGKANRLYEIANEPDLLIIERTDEISADDGARRGEIPNKGRWNNFISNFIFDLLGDHGIATHFYEPLGPRETVVWKAAPIRLEIILRNFATGSLCKNLPFIEGEELGCPIYEIHVKDDARHDPLINECHAVALGLTDFDELSRIEHMTFEVNEILQPFFKHIGLTLVDFKLEFGRLTDGTLALIDEVSPDTCRLWDISTHKKLGAERFRQNLGDEIAAYQELYIRIKRVAGRK